MTDATEVTKISNMLSKNAVSGEEIITMTNEVSFEQWFNGFWMQSDAVSHGVIILLFIMSALSWTQIMIKSWHILRHSRVKKTIQGFWLESTVDKAIKLLSTKLGRSHIFTNLAKSAIAAAHYFDSQKGVGIGKDFGRQEFLGNTLRQSVNHATARLENGMTILASIGAVSPFIGLFGTVYGIYHALIGIAASGSANLNTVSGPVGEALIMTALGLFVAIPAVLAYNSFVRSNRLELLDLESFAHDLHAYLNIGKISTPKK